ncbi:hypothetical protein TpMuguga_02g00038 [Theileria parva strain Muguga]|uniref:Uncharacterized protein n=1 Tax=Theileria parva TaxID=5875 RepID=Q4N699_THEPA|nr:uncharacterized protein TpMuguga_02g00038 [Theileria parva strain Muguga]EAN32324.1 hypothetical protein TpMuguga_02g00038 [Theileria parva strain Muguga]|eukprot:XP_764607.1 hypothetical protein [Theileria parva strain Muguga]
MEAGPLNVVTQGSESSLNVAGRGKFFENYIRNLKTLIEQSPLYQSMNENDTDINVVIERHIKTAKIESMKMSKKIPVRSDGIIDNVPDRPAPITHMGPSGNTSVSKKEEKLRLIPVDIHQKVSSEGVEVVFGFDYKYLEANKDFGIVTLRDLKKTLWIGNRSTYSTQILLYSNGTIGLLVLMLNEKSLKFLERNWYWGWKCIPERFNFKYLDVVDDKWRTFSSFECETELYEHFLNACYSFFPKKVGYQGNTVYEESDNGVMLFSLGNDLLTGNIQTHLFQHTSISIPLESGFGYDLTQEQKEGEAPVTFLGSFSIDFHKVQHKSIDDPKFVSDQQSYFRNLISYENEVNCSSQKEQNTTEELITNYVSLDFDLLLPRYIEAKNKNFRSYKCPPDELFHRIVEGNKNIWKVKKNGLLAKQVHYYIDDDKWVIVVLENNTFKFLYRASDSDVWVDKSSEMFNTKDLKVIKRNRQELSPMDLKFNFFGPLCIIPLGDPVRVSYKNFSHNFEHCGKHISVWLVYDVTTNKAKLETKVFNLRSETRITNPR